MKTEFKAKFLNHLIQRKQDDKGFTLIELLVVIIIIGILAAIALPAFLNQANKAKQSEAKQYVGALMRSQQAYFLEKTAFTSEVNELAKPVATQTENYLYDMSSIVNPTGTDATISVRGQSQKPALKSYTGGVALAQVTTTSEATTAALLCESNSPGSNGAAIASHANVTGSPQTCPANMRAVGALAQ